MRLPLQQFGPIGPSQTSTLDGPRLKQVWVLVCLLGCARTTADYDIKPLHTSTVADGTSCSSTHAAGSTHLSAQSSNAHVRAADSSEQGGSHAALTSVTVDPARNDEVTALGSGGGTPDDDRQATLDSSAGAHNGYPLNGLACDQSKDFGSPLQIAPATTNSSETSISVQSNGLSALISVRSDVTDPSTSLDIKRYFRASTNVPFGSPTEIRGATNVNSSNDEGHVRLSRYGNALYFTRTFADSTSAIYRAQRADNADNFPAPEPLGSIVNFVATMGASWISPDGTAFYWAALDQAFALYHADVTSEGYSNRTTVSVINAVGPVIAPVLTDDQITIYFGSTGTDDTATAVEQVWRATRDSTSAEFEPPSPIAELRDLERPTYPLDVSPDGCILYLAKSASNTSSARHLYQVMKPQ